MSEASSAGEPGLTIRRWELSRMPFVQGFAIRMIAEDLGWRLLEAGEASGELPVQPGSEAHMVHWLKLAVKPDMVVEALYADNQCADAEGTEVTWCIAFREHFGERAGVWQETATNRGRRGSAAPAPDPLRAVAAGDPSPS
ncbi:MAG: hypothetical protein AB1941_24360 [Gemmatimonadota bacterium]